MNKKDWEAKLKEFQEMKNKQEVNLYLVKNTLEEIEAFMETIEAKIKTFK